MDAVNKTAPEAPATKTEADAGSAGKTPAWKKTPVIVVGVLLLAVVSYVGLNVLVFSLTHESTDDAFIAAHVVSVAPRISGQTAAVHVRDNQIVRSNDLLVEIDPANYAIAVAQKRAAADSQDANLKTVIAVDELMRQKVATAEADARKAGSDAAASAATARRAAADFERAKELRRQNTISQQEFDAAQATATQTQADEQSAQDNAASANSKVDEAKTQLAAAEAEVGLAKSQWQEAQTNVAAAELDLSYTKILAPCDGRVTRKAVEPGDFLQAGQQLLSLVPADVWVVANFKETQLKNMRTNQTVSVEIDALGGRKFSAHVESVQAGSGAAFSLLPPENAVGNYVKVVQRVPVKIVFDSPLEVQHVLGPGMSVVPAVRVSDFQAPETAVAAIAVVLAVVVGIFWWRAAKRATASV